MKKKAKPFNSNEVQSTLSVYLAEYEQMRTEILQVQEMQGQLVLYAILSLGAAIPIISSLLEKQIWESLLVIPIVFSSMGWVYAGYVGMMFRVSIYIHNILQPNINTLLHLQESVSKFNVLSWESFARKNKVNLLAMPRNFEVLFFALPSIGALLLYMFIKNDYKSIVTKQSTITVQTNG